MANKFRKIIDSGDSIKDILYYWFPEMISNTMLISLPPLIDAYIVASLKSTMTYGALGMANNFLHVLIKLAEAIPVAAIVTVGRHNGAKRYESCGKNLGDTFWTTTFIGIVLASLIFFNSENIFRWLGVPEHMVSLGVPFLRLKSVVILLIFISLGFFAFMRGVKNTRTPMIIYSISMIVFIFFDWTLVLGKFGFNKMGLMGSGIASIIQYCIIILISIWYITTKKEYKKYFTKIFFLRFSTKRVYRILNLSWPIMIDKGSLAVSYVWLSKMIAPMGKYAIVTFDVIKNLERCAILPAVGFAQIIIFLVSNRLGAQDPDGAKSNIKKVMIITALMLTVTLSFLCLFSKNLVGLFDPNMEFSYLAAPALVIISMLVILDFVQLILAGSLRGAGDVKTVMLARVCCFGLFFTPTVYIISKLPIQNEITKFVMLYGSFYVTTGLVGIIFLWRIKTPKWQNKKI
ncbi:MATE family efflux transporter [Candidatus Babeliales bacterium]|nr:MATE family efflux transporter [Candidatus Babeliales bacterium]